MYVGNSFLCMCISGSVCLCVCFGRWVCVYVCVASRGSERGVNVFAWFAAGHTVHSGTVVFVPLSAVF